MGICNSCESTSVATAKLILQDGRLQEFSYPIKASYILQKDPNIFICNSDEMELGGIVSAVKSDQELQLGQLYFALPLNRLKRKLKAEEMAELAVKASSALNSLCGKEKCGCRNKVVLFSGEKDGGKLEKKVAGGGGLAVAEGRRGRRSSGGGGGERRGKFTGRLSAIPE